MDGMILTQGGAGTYERFTKIVQTIAGPGYTGQSMVDLCCHVARLTRHMGFAKMTFVDIGNYVEEFTGLEFIHADVIAGTHEVFGRRFDHALCLDGIEHVHKPEGRILLSRMEAMSGKQILFTPLDAWMVEPHNPAPESHKCVWSPEELPGWAHLKLPEWHPQLGIGAFFFWKCDDIAADFERVRRELGL